MLNVKQEPLITLSAACRGPINKILGRRIAPATACRWVKSGIRAGDGTRVLLSAIKVGRSYMTNPSAIDEFFSTLAQRTSSSVEMPEIADAETEASLRAAGLKQ
ncbi:MAG: hypothetical protein HQ518_24705 [Rhodopirellula sp.]|nr:hypothetical protein [Rhodopirellula sp.]